MNSQYFKQVSLRDSKVDVFANLNVFTTYWSSSPVILSGIFKFDGKLDFYSLTKIAKTYEALYY